VSGKDSSEEPAPTATAEVEFEERSFTDGGDEETVEFVAAPGEIKVSVMKENFDGSVVNAQQETVQLSGTTAFDESYTDSGNTGVFRAEVLFDDVPPGEYTVSVDIAESSVHPAQSYSETVSLGSDQRENVRLGP